MGLAARGRGLALAARTIGQPLVSDHAPLPPAAPCRLGRSVAARRDGFGVGGAEKAGVGLDMASMTDIFDLATRYHQSGNLVEAGSLYRQVLDADPNHVGALNNLGILLKKQGRLAEAVECYRLALRSNPGHANAHLNLGNALKDQGRPAEA